ncbi:hypothetical protein SAMD00019534_033680, partial [Acytostelium subglobosum LB1]|uniref:hypothetical protein n=1 Tax=Acytostelium subglobosum LB1 TaxID=1410327 RepID=UPI000644DAF5
IRDMMLSTTANKHLLTNGSSLCARLMIRSYTTQPKQDQTQQQQQGQESSLRSKKKVSDNRSLPKVPPIQPKAPAPNVKDLSSNDKINNYNSHFAPFDTDNTFRYTPSFSKLGVLTDIKDLPEDWNNIKHHTRTKKEKRELNNTSTFFDRNDNEEANIQFTPAVIQVPQGGSYARALLNTRSTLNALDNSTLDLLQEFVKSNIANDTITSYSIHTSTPGVIHSSGADFLTMYEKRNSENPEAYFRKLYKFFYLLGISPKPHVSILDGLAVGSGAAFTANSGIRVATENAIFSVPDCAIGFYPDAGMTRFLARMGPLGRYLALTGRRLRGTDIMESGIGNMFIRTGQVQHIDQWLGRIPANRIDRVLQNLDLHTENYTKDTVEKTHLEQYGEAIERCFDQENVEDIYQALREEKVHTKWAQRCIQNMDRMSPLSLKVTLAFMNYVERPSPYDEDVELSLDDYFEMEYRLTCSLLQEGSDLWEGIRANLINRTKPDWKFKTLAEVTDEIVEKHINFEPERKFQLRRFPTNFEQYEKMVEEYYENTTSATDEQDLGVFTATSGDPITARHEEFIEEYYKDFNEDYFHERNFEETIYSMDKSDFSS